MTAAQHRFEDLGPPLLPPTATGHFRAAFRLPCLASVDQEQLYGCVRMWALEALQDATLASIPAMRAAAGPRSTPRMFTARQCCGLLANAFLGNVVDLMVGQKSASQQGGLS